MSDIRMHDAYNRVPRSLISYVDVDNEKIEELNKKSRSIGWFLKFIYADSVVSSKHFQNFNDSCSVTREKYNELQALCEILKGIQIEIKTNFCSVDKGSVDKGSVNPDCANFDYVGNSNFIEVFCLYMLNFINSKIKKIDRIGEPQVDIEDKKNLIKIKRNLEVLLSNIIQFAMSSYKRVSLPQIIERLITLYKLSAFKILCRKIYDNLNRNYPDNLGEITTPNFTNWKDAKTYWKQIKTFAKTNSIIGFDLSTGEPVYDLDTTKSFGGVSKRPSKRPTKRPSKRPTKRPSKRPSKRPTKRPSKRPSKRPAKRPSKKPSKKPSKRPSKRPSKKPRRGPGKK
jgi:hypothetical protein